MNYYETEIEERKNNNVIIIGIISVIIIFALIIGFLKYTKYTVKEIDKVEVVSLVSDKSNDNYKVITNKNAIEYGETYIDDVLSRLETQIGKPYKLGGGRRNIKTFDCSSYASYGYKPHIFIGWYTGQYKNLKYLKVVNYKDRQPGDLVYMGLHGIDHVKVVAGDITLAYEASGSKKMVVKRKLRYSKTYTVYRPKRNYGLFTAALGTKLSVEEVRKYNVWVDKNKNKSIYQLFEQMPKDKFKSRLIAIESSNKPGALSKSGYAGYFQLGKESGPRYMRMCIANGDCRKSWVWRGIKTPPNVQLAMGDTIIKDLRKRSSNLLPSELANAYMTHLLGEAGYNISFKEILINGGIDTSKRYPIHEGSKIEVSGYTILKNIFNNLTDVSNYKYGEIGWSTKKKSYVSKYDPKVSKADQVKMFKELLIRVAYQLDNLKLLKGIE